MQRGWESEIGGSRPGTEMVGGDFLSPPRPCMGCSAWVDGWISNYYKYMTCISEILLLINSHKTTVGQNSRHTANKYWSGHTSPDMCGSL
jgi:hypothetical protein